MRGRFQLNLPFLIWKFVDGEQKLVGAFSHVDEAARHALIAWKSGDYEIECYYKVTDEIVLRMHQRRAWHE